MEVEAQILEEEGAVEEQILKGGEAQFLKELKVWKAQILYEVEPQN